MTTSSIGSTISSSVSSGGINPTVLAQELATAYTSSAQSLLTTQSQNATNTASGLTTLQSALQAFQAAVTGLQSKPTVAQQTATFSNSAVGTASANGSAQAGSYSFFVSQLASANQQMFQSMPANTPAAGAGTLGLSMPDGTSLSVNLAAADSNNDGKLTPAEIAAAINAANGNSGKIAATVMTVNGQSQLMLTANHTGANSQITLDTSQVGNAALQAALNSPTELTKAQDAIFWVGAENTGIKVQQASNSYTGIAGVGITFTQAQASGSPSVTLTVAADNSGTAKNVQTFVSAYNTLKQTLDSLTDPGDASKNKAAGIFASDAGVQSLQSHLAAILRQTFNGQTLFHYGVSADRDGNLSLDQTKLQNALASTPTGLDQVFGGMSSGGLLGTTNTYLKSWLDVTKGQITTRQNSVQRLQKDLSQRQTNLTNQYNDAYNRYLTQFSQLQALQAQMSQSSGILGNLSSS
jgi:flagellar hook-associated protein 2